MFRFKTNLSFIGTIGSSFSEDDSKDNMSLYSNSNLNIFVKSQLNILNNNESSLIYNNSLKTEESENKNLNNKPVFITEIGKKKRGKEAKKKNKKEHRAWSRDNIISKIQIHFLNFVIFFLNDCIHQILKNNRMNFKKFNYKEKSNSTFEHANMLKNLTINELLEFFIISKKYTRYNENINKTNKEKLEQNPWFKKFLKIKYTTLFYYYFNKCQSLKEIFLFGEKIILSKKTKPFSELLQKNEKYKEEIIETAKDVYLNHIILK